MLVWLQSTVRTCRIEGISYHSLSKVGWLLYNSLCYFNKMQATHFEAADLGWKNCFYFFIWDTETEFCHLLVHSPDSCNSCGRARPKPGTWNSFLVSPVGGRGVSAWAITCCLPGCTLQEGIRSGAGWDSNLGMPLWVTGVSSPKSSFQTGVISLKFSLFSAKVAVKVIFFGLFQRS